MISMLDKIISKGYTLARICYAFPFVFLLIFIIDSNTVDATEMAFFAFFLLSMFPCALAGLVFTGLGFDSWKTKGGYEYRDKGIWLFIIGAVLLWSGFFGFGLIYVLVMG